MKRGKRKAEDDHDEENKDNSDPTETPAYVGLSPKPSKRRKRCASK